MIDQRTHWDDCWRERSHHDCAVARIESLLKELASQSVPINMDEFRPMTPSEHAKVNNALRARIAELERERDQYHDALIARHGGEPVALLAELDEARARVAELEADLERMTAARNRDHQQALMNGAALAAERERREAAEEALRLALDPTRAVNTNNN